MALRDWQLLEGSVPMCGHTAWDLSSYTSNRSDPGVANGFARLWINDHKLFDALEEPLIAAMPEFNVVHLAAVAFAHGRLLRRDEALLSALASRLWQCCQSSPEEVDPLSLSSTMHAFVLCLCRARLRSSLDACASCILRYEASVARDARYDVTIESVEVCQLSVIDAIHVLPQGIST
eukprot:s1864_g8.t1